MAGLGLNYQGTFVALLIGFLLSTSAAATPVSAPPPLNCEPGQSQAAVLSITLGELAKGYRNDFSSPGICTLRVEALTQRPSGTGFRFVVALQDASGGDLDSTWIGGNSGMAAGDIDVFPGEAAALSFALDTAMSGAPDLPSERLGDRLEFKVSLSGRAPDLRFARLTSWLKMAGLSEELRILDICQVTATPEGPCSVAANAAAAVAGERRKPGQPPITADAILGKDETWLRENEVPAFLLIIRPPIPNYQLDALEAAYEKKHGVDLWRRMFSRLADAYDRPSSDFVISVDVPCSESTYYMLRPGEMEGTGLVCTAASFGVQAPAFSKLGGGGVAGAKLKGFASFDDTLSKLISAEFGPGANVTFLERDDAYAEFIVRGVKGVVVQGGANWERLQLSFMLKQPTGSAPTALRVFADGRLAASLGGYPPDTQFTEDIEVKHGQRLGEFTKCIATGAVRIADGKPYNRCH